MKKARLSLEQFKAKAETSSQVEKLKKISGGVLGACHCVCGENGSLWHSIGHGIDMVWSGILGLVFSFIRLRFGFLYSCFSHIVINSISAIFFVIIHR